ncbi:MAG: nucleotidyltransferase family protein [Candidatus Melainabacteria bacterium]|nr:nucleotidyltransferase family protein [Candidatus Melainabacteria bacterium]
MKAIILAGGKGERLSPLTSNCPKGMIKIEGKPILEYQIEWLKKYGVTEIIFACGYLHEKIKEHFRDGDNFGIKVFYSVEDEPLGRGGAIKKALSIQHSAFSSFLVMNGDVLTEMNLSLAINAHNLEKKDKNIIATICLFPYKSPYGIVRVEKDGLINNFDEKGALPYWLNGGIYIFEAEIKKYLPDKGDHETTTFPELASKKLLYGYKSIDFWRGIDTIKDLNEFLVT